MNTQKGIIKALLVAVATAFLSAPAIAASVDIYVATAADGGSDGNAGTGSTPFLTLSNAVVWADAAIAGGAESVTIHVAPGTYDISGDDAPLLLQHTVTLVGDPSDPSKVVILNNSTTHRSVTLNHASAALKGVTLDRTTSEAAYFAAWNAAGHVNLAQGLLEDCVVRGAVLGNASATTAQGANVYVSGGVVRRCKILNGKAAVKTGNTSAIRGYWAIGNLYVNGTVGKEILVEDCLIAGGSATGSANSEATAVRKAGNVLVQGSCRIVNCTVANGSGGTGVGGLGIAHHADNTDCRIINCALYGNSGGAYNARDWGVSAAACADWYVNCAVGTTAPNATCAVVGAAAFRNYARGEFYLTPKSPLVDAGLPWDECEALCGALSATDLFGAPRLRGGRPDIGCYELVDPLDVYVAPNGNDANDGTVQAPLRTAARGVEIADEALAKSNVPSVNVHLADGTYDITENAAALSLTNAISLVGRPDAPSKVVILNNSASHQSVLLDNQDAALKGVTVARTDNDGTEGKGHVMINNAGLLEDCVITNGLIGSTMTAGYYNGGNVHMNNGGTLRRCKILDGRSLNPDSEVGQATSYYSIGNLYVQTAVNAVLVENCLIAGGYAPDMSYQSKSGLIPCSAGNVFLNANRTKSVMLVNCTIADGRGGYVRGIYVGSMALDSALGKIVNCAIYGNRGTGTLEYNGNDGYFVNCAFSSDANYGGATSSITDLTDASFRDCAHRDYSPRNKNSALIDAGTSWEEYEDTYGASSATDVAGKRRLRGERLDIGCHEYFDPGLIFTVQ